MIHFKSNRFGFTLVETMLAMVIVGMVLTPIFLLFGTITQRMNRSTKHFYALLMGKNLLYEARQKQDSNAHEFALEKKVDEFDILLQYRLQAQVGEKSLLLSQEGLHKEVVTITWTDQGKKHTDQLVSYIYKQPEQKKS